MPMKIERHLGYMLGGTMVMWVQNLTGGAWTRPKIIVVKGQQSPIQITSKDLIYKLIEAQGGHKPSIAAAKIVLHVLRDDLKVTNPNQTELL